MEMSNTDSQIGNEFLQSIGINKNDKYICLSIHDNYYLESEFSNEDWSHHNIRVSNIDNYIESIKFLNNKGIFVIRMGRHTRKKLEINSKHFYDYSSSKFKSDMLDFYLISRCYFYISNSTGLDNVALLFNKPLLKSSHSFINVDTENEKNILFFNLHYDIKNKKYLNYKEIMKIKSFNYSIYKSKFFAEQNIELKENKSNEIKKCVEEMLNSMNNKLNIDSHQKNLSNEFWKEYSQFYANLGNNYYLKNPIKANISPSYLLNQFNITQKK